MSKINSFICNGDDEKLMELHVTATRQNDAFLTEKGHHSRETKPVSNIYEIRGLIFKILNLENLGRHNAMRSKFWVNFDFATLGPLDINLTCGL